MVILPPYMLPDLSMQKTKFPLKFSKVEGVKKYILTITNNGIVLKQIEFDADDYEGNSIIEGMAKYTNLLDGGVYDCMLIASKTDYSVDEGIELYGSEATKLSLRILSAPSQISISHYEISWGSVIGADSYSIFDENNNLIASNILSTSFDASTYVASSSKTNFSFKVMANVAERTNCLAGNKYSDLITFDVLSKTNISLNLNANTIYWDEVVNAVGYQLTLIN